VLAELFAQQIEAHSALRVERRVNLGGTFICHQALISGKIDLYPDTQEPPSPNPEGLTRCRSNRITDVSRVQQEYRGRFNVEVMPPLGFNNTFAMVIRGDDAENFICGKFPTSGNTLRNGARDSATNSWSARTGIAAGRGLWSSLCRRPKILDLGLLYRALADHQVDLVAGNSTDGSDHALGMVVLEDDRHYFPPYEAVPLVRRATLDQHPEVGAALGALAGKISEEEMRRMNYAVDGEHRDPADVAREFRIAKWF